MYGGLMEIMKNHQYYYTSSVGPSYCHFTEEGKSAVADYINLISGKMIEAENSELNARSKEIIMKTLKGDAE